MIKSKLFVFSFGNMWLTPCEELGECTNIIPDKPYKFKVFNDRSR